MHQIFLLALVSYLAFAPSTFAQEQALEPSFKEGDTWQIDISRKGQIGSSTAQNEGRYELVLEQGKVKVFQIDGNQKVELNVQSESSAEGLLGLLGKNPRRPDLKFPLSVGKKWNYEAVIEPGAGRPKQRRAAEVVVVGMEEVTTPAGSFKTFKLVRSESWTGGGRSVLVNSSTSTFFYSPQTRSIVKSISESANSAAVRLMELVAFRPGN